MKAAHDQQQTDRFPNPSRSLKLPVTAKFAAVFSMGLTTSLLLGTPAFGQTTSAANQKQNLTCVTEGQRLVCDVQQIKQASEVMTFEQKADVGEASETVELTPVKRTALFNPELDGILSSGLLWAFYLSFPIAVIVAVWHYDRRAQNQMVKLVQHMATLERIWQSPQTR